MFTQSYKKVSLLGQNRGVTLHLFPTEATKRHSGKTSFLLHMTMVPFFRIPGYLLVFLKASRYVGKDI